MRESMILSIHTEYAVLSLVSPHPIDVEKVLEIKENFKKDMKLWNQKKDDYFKKHDIDEDKINEEIRNFKGTEKSDRFTSKRFDNIVEKHKTMIDFYNYYTRPDYTLINKFLAIGFHKLAPSNSDINVNLKLESNDIKNKVNIKFNN